MINGTKIQISCNPITTTAQQVFESVIKHENLQDNFFLGLCALVGGDFVFLPMDLKIYKVRFFFEVILIENCKCVILTLGGATDLDKFA